MKKKIKTKKFKTIKDYLETCSEDEKEFIYQTYFDMSVDELVEIIFGNLPPDDVIEEIFSIFKLFRLDLLFHNLLLLFHQMKIRIL